MPLVSQRGLLPCSAAHLAPSLAFAPDLNPPPQSPLRPHTKTGNGSTDSAGWICVELRIGVGNQLGRGEAVQAQTGNGIVAKVAG